MSDNSNEGARRRRRRSGSRAQGSGHSSRSQTPRAGHQEPTGFQKLLNVLSFGILGKPKAPPPRARSQTLAKTGLRTERAESSSRSPREPRPKREPASVNPADITTERLYVGNLSYDATESDLFELFQGVGSVRNAEVVINTRTERSKGFAFVTMGSVEEARRAVQELNGKDFMGRPLQLSGAKPIGSGEGRSRESSSTEA
jgi:hypothetical protein